MKAKIILYAICALFLLTSAVDCIDEYHEGIVELTGIELRQYNNSGKHPVSIENGQCPKEAYLIGIVPIFDFHHYTRNILKSPMIAFRIITLTDFNEDYPAGSDIQHLFKHYPSTLLGKDFSDSLSSDCLEKGQPVTTIDEGAFYKVLLTYPQPGNYQFRIELEMEDGSIVSEETEINLY